MRVLFPLVLALFALCGMESRCRAAITLVANAKSDYVIVISEKASVSEIHAATELQHFLKEMSGAELPVVVGDGGSSKKMIVLGEGEALRALKIKVDLSALGDEGFNIRTVGTNLVITGGRKRGTMYGVYAFLEKLGCRWYALDATVVPKKTTIKIGSLNVTEKPDFEYREPFFGQADDPDWAARNRVNGHNTKLDETRGGKVSYGRFCHTFDEIVPVEKYMKDHPEYLSLVNGKRIGGQYTGQLCLTNPDLVKIAVDAVNKWIEENPSATIFSVTQNDGVNYCQCEKCKAVDAEEGSPSGLMLRFVNAVADEVGKEHPDKLIDTFAYQYTEAPPKITVPRPNVRVRLCPIACCNHHDYETCEKDKPFMDNFRGWDKITDTLYIWHYACNFRHYWLPFPDLDQLVSSMRMYKRYGVRGVFVQATEAGDVVFMHGLKSYLLAKLLWNSKADSKAIIKDFLNGYYGKAGKPIGEILDLLQETVRRENIHGGCFDGVDRFFLFDSKGRATRFLTPAIMARAWELVHQAEKVAESPEILKRVGEVKMSFECVDMIRQAQNAAAGTAEEKAAALSMVEAFGKKSENAGMRFWGAGTSLQTGIDQLAAPLRK